MGTYDWIAAVHDTAVFTAFDTETTGLDTATCRIVEIGAIRFDARGIAARYNVLINPGCPMPEDAGKVNGITDEMLKDKPPIADIFPDFLDFTRETILVAHNAPFDINFINAELKCAGMQELKNKVIDTRIFAKEIFRGLLGYALQDLAVQFGITAIEAHRAEDDARVCMELFKHTVNHFLKTNAALAEKIRKEYNALANIDLKAEIAQAEEKDYSQSLF